MLWPKSDKLKNFGRGSQTGVDVDSEQDGRTRSKTPLMSDADLAALGAPDLVYIRAVSRSEADLSKSSDAKAELHAIHGADGDRLGVFSSRAAAFAAAAQNDLAPVSVH